MTGLDQIALQLFPTVYREFREMHKSSGGYGLSKDWREDICKEAYRLAEVMEKVRNERNEKCD